MKLVCVTALISIVFVLAANGEICTEEKIQECMEPLSDYSADVNAAVVIYLSEEDLREHCRLYELFNTCMRDVRPHCGQVDLLVFEGIDDAYHFLCDEAFDEYLEYRECFNNTKLHEEGDYCNATLTTKLDNLDENQSYDYKRDRICQYAADYLDCVENAVVSFCGVKAGKWQRELDERSLRPLLATLNCPGITYDTDWWDRGSGDSLATRYVIAAALTVVTVIILVLVILMVMVYRKRKRQQESVQQQMRAPHQVHYAHGSGAGANSVSIIPPGLYPGEGAGPLPEKGVLPPPYTTGESTPYPSAALAPPAYSDITARAGGSERGAVGGGVNGFANPALSISDDPQYVDNVNTARPSKAGSSYSSNR